MGMESYLITDQMPQGENAHSLFISELLIQQTIK